MKRAIIDRFEGDFAICEMEDGSFLDIDIHIIPEDASEGDVIIICDDCIQIDAEATDRRRKRIKELMKDMWDE